MDLKKFVREGIGSLSRRRLPRWKESEESGFASAPSSPSFESKTRENWAGIPPELLREVVARLEKSEESWPARRNLVAFASICRSWRRICKEVVGVPERTGKLTFPVSIKQPGFRDAAIQCYVKRSKSTATFQLFLGLQPDNGKFLLSARKIRRPTYSEYIISMAADDISRSSPSCVGKLRSNFLGTKFAIFDIRPPDGGGAVPAGRPSRRKVSPKLPTLSFGIAHISYELNMLGTRGPRRMRCVVHSIPAVAAANSPPPPGGKLDSVSARFVESCQFSEVSAKDGALVLRNKAPRWHEQLQCWCLNFRGRVTVASVKNFQLIAATTEAPAASGDATDHDRIILQFGKIGKDLFTMDYRYPLSAFQAFAICLSSFDAKLACE